jgi:O-antigen/teichoic acid export membrane protein
MFKRYSDFPRYRLPSQFLLMFAIQAPLLFSAWLFGSETTGQLGLALMALALPMNLFGQSIGQAYYAEIAKIGRKNPRKIYILTKNITEKLFLVSIPPFLVLILVGPHVFSFVFGEQWREAGVFSRILALYLLTQFISTPLVNALSVFDKQGMFLRINMIRSIAIIMVFGLAYLCRLSPMYAILIYSIVLSVHYIFTSISVFSVIRNSLA